MRKIYIYIISGLFLFKIYNVHAADFSFGPNRTVGNGSKFQIDVLISTEGENINAVEGNLVFDPKILLVEGVKVADSVISLWAKDPGQEVEVLKTGRIGFSGVTPGGFNSFVQNRKLFSIVFQAKKAGQASIALENLQALLNDGKATPAKINKSATIITVVEGLQTSSDIIEVRDIESPGSLFVQVVQDEITGGKWGVVFYGQDKQSGISHYEVAEQSGAEVFDFTKLSWQAAKSPAILQDQTRRSFVYIKAIDKQGNEKVVVVPPPAVGRYHSLWFWCIIILSLLFFSFVGGKLWSRRKKENTRPR